jgi:hypothetical protein
LGAEQDGIGPANDGADAKSPVFSVFSREIPVANSSKIES